MKLLMVSNYFESPRGGLEIIGGRLARELVRLGQDVRRLASNATPASAVLLLGGVDLGSSAFWGTENFGGLVPSEAMRLYLLRNHDPARLPDRVERLHQCARNPRNPPEGKRRLASRCKYSSLKSS